LKNIKEPRNIKLPEDPVAKEKLNFWKRLWISIKDFERYQELAGEKVTTAVRLFLQDCSNPYHNCNHHSHLSLSYNLSKFLKSI